MKQSTVLLLSLSITMAANLRVFGGNQGGVAKSVQQAAIDGDVEQLKLHIAKGANFNSADQYGYTPLKRAIEGHHAEAAKVIIESGKADINAKDPGGSTPLIVAATNAEKEIAEALIAKGADIKAKDGNEGTALHAALRSGLLDLATLLIDKGADVNATDKSGVTPLTLAQQRNAADVVELLKKKGAKEPTTSLNPYGDYGYAGNQGPQGPGAAPSPAPARRTVEIDPNAIVKLLKEFEGLTEALKPVDDKSEAEQQGWIQRRIDNRTALLAAVDRQFTEEMAFVKPVAVQEKAEKTSKAIDDLSGKRKKRSEQIAAQLRDQRRSSLAQNQQMGSGTGGRSVGRGVRGRTGNTGMAGSTGYSAGGPYGAAGTRMPPRRPVEVNQPVIDQETQAQIQAWLNAKPEDKKSLLDAVHQMNVADLDDLLVVAEEEKAAKTGAAIQGLMMLRQRRVEKIGQKWQEDDARMQKLQERYGPGGMPPGRGMMPGTPQQNQPGMRGRRVR